MAKRKSLLDYATGKYFHRSLRKDDVDPLLEVIGKMEEGTQLSDAEIKFINDLREEDSQRYKLYNQRAREKRKQLRSG